MKIEREDDWKQNQVNGQHTVSTIDYQHASVRILHFAKGYDIPRHHHDSEALHILLSGAIQMDSGEIVTARSAYKCGGWEYMGVTLDETEVIVVEPHDPSK